MFLQRSCIVNYVYTGELEVEQLGDALVVAVSFMFDPVQPVQIKPQSVVETLHISVSKNEIHDRNVVVSEQSKSKK